MRPIGVMLFKDRVVEDIQITVIVTVNVNSIADKTIRVKWGLWSGFLLCYYDTGSARRAGVMMNLLWTVQQRSWG
jgi:hypothetical protein